MNCLLMCDQIICQKLIVRIKLYKIGNNGTHILTYFTIIDIYYEVIS